MHHFHYSGHDLHCESVDLAAVAKLYGTPTYVYSAATMEDNYRRLHAGLAGLDVELCYAMKANSNLAVLRHFANLGAGFDLVSGGEIRRVLAAGANVRTSVFAGVGKTEAEIELALQNLGTVQTDVVVPQLSASFDTSITGLKTELAQLRAEIASNRGEERAEAISMVGSLSDIARKFSRWDDGDDLCQRAGLALRRDPGSRSAHRLFRSAGDGVERRPPLRQVSSGSVSRSRLA
jgi:hypothetical protein